MEISRAFSKMMGNRGIHNIDKKITIIKRKLKNVNSAFKEEADTQLIKLYAYQDIYENLFHCFNENLKYQYSLKTNSGNDLLEHLKEIFLPEVENPLENEIKTMQHLKEGYLNSRNRLISLGVSVSELPEQLDYLERLN